MFDVLFCSLFLTIELSRMNFLLVAGGDRALEGRISPDFFLMCNACRLPVDLPLTSGIGDLIPGSTLCPSGFFGVLRFPLLVSQLYAVG